MKRQTSPPPTAANVRKAFRRAVDTVGLDPEIRRVVLDAFIEELASRRRPVSDPQRRRQQNQALKDWDRLVATIAEHGEQVRHAILRNRFTTGQRHSVRGELGAMEGTPGPYSGDPTGEEACWDELNDQMGKTISDMCEDIGRCLTTADRICNLSSTDVAERARRTIPDCLICTKPIEGEIRARCHRACNDRWRYYARMNPGADRLRWEAEQRKQASEISQDDDQP